MKTVRLSLFMMALSFFTLSCGSSNSGSGNLDSARVDSVNSMGTPADNTSSKTAMPPDTTHTVTPNIDTPVR